MTAPIPQLLIGWGCGVLTARPSLASSPTHRRSVGADVASIRSGLFVAACLADCIHDGGLGGGRCNSVLSQDMLEDMRRPLVSAFAELA